MSDEDLEKFNDLVEKGANDELTQLERAIAHVNEWDVDDEVESTSPSNNANAKMWAVYGNTFSPCEKAVDKLVPGQYLIEHSSDRGVYFSNKDVNLDELLELPDSASEEVIGEVETFWTKEKHFRDFGFLWKRGVLLWGPPGSGKTSTLQIISQRIIDKGGLSIYVTNPELGAKGLELLRRIEPNRPIVVMLEDIDAITQNYGEASILALLDGELQIDNVVFIATTNYPERLDKRLINRPSRFDIIKLIDMPSDDAREVFIKAKNPRLATKETYDELKQWVKDTDKFSIAHLKELIIAVEVFEVPVENAISRLKKMMNIDLSSDKINRRQFGFTANHD